MAEMIRPNTLSCTARGIVKQYNRPITVEDMEDLVDVAGFSQYVPIAKSGALCGKTLTGADFPYTGDVEIVAYNAAKVE
jgi:hypothetical protein